MKFSQRLKKSLNAAEISQKELCEKMNLPKSTISQWCTGRSTPTLARFYQLCKVINESADYLLGLD